jgi:transposase
MPMVGKHPDAPKSREARKGRRRFTLEDKRRVVLEATSPKSSVADVALRYSIAPSLVYRWCKQADQTQGDPLRLPSTPHTFELPLLRTRVKELERILGKLSYELEVLKEQSEVVFPRKSAAAAKSKTPAKH